MNNDIERIKADVLKARALVQILKEHIGTLGNPETELPLIAQTEAIEEKLTVIASSD